MTWQEQIERIEQRQAEVRAFVTEQRTLNKREVRTLCALLTVGMAIGATVFGGGMLVAKLID
jgi:hypothetical protein